MKSTTMTSFPSAATADQDEAARIELAAGLRIPSPDPKAAVQHPGEPLSNAVRRGMQQFEPACLRTFTPSLAAIERSAGCWHWTADGRKLVDFTSGVLVANLGHNPVGWWKRVRELMNWDAPEIVDGYAACSPLSSYNAVGGLEVDASRRLIETLRSQPGGGRCEQVMWAASGSEAVQKALWAAMGRRPGQDIILATRHGFHGKKGLAGAVTGHEDSPERDRRVRFVSFPQTACENLDRRREPLDLAPYRRELEALWAEYGQKLCCLITEPYLGGGGSYHPQPEYLQLLQRFCREHDLVFILDEVQANFGRTGELFAFTQYGLEPDVVVLGKGLGNGVAVSAAVGPAKLFAPMKYGEGSDTWSGNPLASAAVVATLEAFDDGRVMEHARRLGQTLEAGLRRLVSETPLVAHLRGECGVWGLEIRPCGRFDAPAVAAALVEACYLGDESGRAVHLLGPLAGKVIRISPPLTTPLAVAEDSLDCLLGIFQAVARRLAG